MAAKAKYKVVPSKLKLKPVGNTKATTSLVTPNCSIFSIADGKAASELAVPKAILTGCVTYFINRFNGIFAIQMMGKNTNSTSTINAIYKVTKSSNKL